MPCSISFAEIAALLLDTAQKFDSLAAMAKGTPEDVRKSFKVFLDDDSCGFSSTKARWVKAGDLRCFVDGRTPVHYTQGDKPHVTISKSDVLFLICMTRRADSSYIWQAWQDHCNAQSLEEAERVVADAPHDNLHFYLGEAGSQEKDTLADLFTDMIIGKDRLPNLWEVVDCNGDRSVSYLWPKVLDATATLVKQAAEQAEGCKLTLDDLFDRQKSRWRLNPDEKGMAEHFWQDLLKFVDKNLD